MGLLQKQELLALILQALEANLIQNDAAEVEFLAGDSGGHWLVL